VFLGYLEGLKERCSNKSDPDNLSKLVIKVFDMLVTFKKCEIILLQVGIETFLSRNFFEFKIT